MEFNSDEMLSFEQNTVLKISCKYYLELPKGNTKKPLLDVYRYTVDFFFRVVDNTLSCKKSQLAFVVSEIIIKEYLCQIQTSRITWNLASIINYSKKTLIYRIHLKNCKGCINIPLSKISKNDNYIYHLYKDKRTPSKFTLKGVPKIITNNYDYINALNRLTTIFIKKIPVNKEIDECGSLKFVKTSSSLHKHLIEEEFKEIETAIPWGFQAKKKTTRSSKKI